MVTYTIGLAEAKNNFSRVTQEIRRTKRSVTVMKNNKPWVVISPVDADEKNATLDLMESINYSMVDLDDED